MKRKWLQQEPKRTKEAFRRLRLTKVKWADLMAFGTCIGGIFFGVAVLVPSNLLRFFNDLRLYSFGSSP